MTHRFINADSLAVIGENAVDCNLFTYCQNNPILYYDPSGHVIVIAESATDEEIEQYERAVAYIKKSDVGKALIEKLERSDIVFVIILATDGKSKFNSEDHTITFNVYGGVLMADGISVQSPALSLAHEMGHAAQFIDGEIKPPVIVDMPLMNYPNELIESGNLIQYETPIATALGEPCRNHYLEGIGIRTMNNSTHYRTQGIRSWWWCIMPWNWGKSNVIAIEHNAT